MTLSLDLGPLFDALGQATVKFKAGGGFDGGLVTAPAQSHLQRLAGHPLRLHQVGSAPATPMEKVMGVRSPVAMGASHPVS